MPQVARGSNTYATLWILAEIDLKSECYELYRSYLKSFQSSLTAINKLPEEYRVCVKFPVVEISVLF